jgi:5-methylcytosine-specific restriction enzyme subunit McrC
MDAADAVELHTGPRSGHTTAASGQPPIELAEHSESDPLTLTPADQSFLEDLASDGGPLTVTYTRSGQPKLSTSRYVGVAGLPSGRRLEVTPKETVSRLLDLLRYALDVPSETIREETGLPDAGTFIDAFGALFTAKLRTLLTRGIRRSYTRVEAVDHAVRGRLDVQRQLQRPTPIPTDFAVEYDTLTANTTRNQAILAATQVLTRLVSDRDLSQRLNRQALQLEQLVEPAYVTPTEIDAITTTRLDAYYEDLLALSKLVLERRFFEDLTSGSTASFGLFVNMATVFEAVTERAARSAITDRYPDWTVKGQGSLAPLLDGPHAVDMQPDVVIRDDDGRVRLVVDAKWKTGGDSPSDVYQLTSYMQAEGVSGVLVYPEHDDDSGMRESRLVRGEDVVLRSVQLPTAAQASESESYIEAIVTELEDQLTDLLGSASVGAVR